MGCLVIFHEGLAFLRRLLPPHSTKHFNEPFIPNILAERGSIAFMGKSTSPAPYPAMIQLLLRG
jgi:hypothetical protein